MLPPQPGSCNPITQEMREFGLHPLCFQVSLQFNDSQPKGNSASKSRHKADRCSWHRPPSPELQLTQVHVCVGMRVFALGALSWLLQHHLFQLRDSMGC